MSEFEYWALTIKMSPQSCKEESQYPRPTGLQMTTALWPPRLSTMPQIIFEALGYLSSKVFGNRNKIA